MPQAIESDKSVDKRRTPLKSHTKVATSLRIAIVHDWLVGGGAELVVEQLHKMYPDAPIYTSYCTREWRRRLDKKVVTGYLQLWPFSKLRKFIPFLRIWWFTGLDLDKYDLVISTSGAEAKGIIVNRRPHLSLHKAINDDNILKQDSKTHQTVHINYCHAPTHYYWSRYDEYMKNPGFGIFDWAARIGLKTLVKPLRRWDFKAAQRPDYIISNSTHIQNEVLKYYGRSSVVVHPPIATKRFIRAGRHKLTRSGFVIAGRQTPYKRFDLAVATCSKLNLPLTVIGSGPENKRLRKLAGPSITFLGRVSDEVVAEEFAGAEAFIFPTNVEDFGITPIEAMAAGTPVISYKAGGPLDYVVPGKTGVFFNEQTAKSLALAIKRFKAIKFDNSQVSRESEQFSSEAFEHKMTNFISKVMSKV